MIVLNGNIYLERANSYVKCDLKKDKSGAYYLEESDVTIRRLVGNYESLTWGELIARYSNKVAATPQPVAASTRASASSKGKKEE